jgi:DNA gyrase/topoisomerase IV subunit A
MAAPTRHQLRLHHRLLTKFPTFAPTTYSESAQGQYAQQQATRNYYSSIFQTRAHKQHWNKYIQTQTRDISVTLTLLTHMDTQILTHTHTHKCTRTQVTRKDIFKRAEKYVQEYRTTEKAHTHTYTHTHMFDQAYMHTNTRAHTRTHTKTCARTHTWAHIHPHLYTHRS